MGERLRARATSEGWRIAIVACACVVSVGLSGCAAETDASAAAASESLRFDYGPPPVIFDHDADFDDMAALAYMVRQHKAGEIDLRLITVTSAGAGFYGGGIRHTRCLLEQLGASDIPVADSPAVGANPFPLFLRGTVDFILTDLEPGCTASADPSEVPAPEAILDVLEASHRPVTVVVTGPTTNVADAIRLRTAEGGRPFRSEVGRVWVMGGALGIPTQLCCGLEELYDQTQTFNIWADPDSAQVLLDDLLPFQVTLIGYNATQQVPINPAFSERLLTEGTTDEAQYVGAISTHPIILAALAAGIPGYWWDPLTGVASTTPGIVDYGLRRVRVLTEPGPSTGRLEEVRHGRGAWVVFAVDADQAAFEDAFLQGLNAPVD